MCAINMEYQINKVNDRMYQISGGVNGWMSRNSNTASNLNHYDFGYQFFFNGKLIKVRGACKDVKHLKAKIDASRE